MTFNTKAPLRIRFRPTSDINTGFVSLEISYVSANKFSDSVTTGITASKIAHCSYKKYNSDGSYEFLPSNDCSI